MGTKGEGNRQRIIEAADSLFYRRGYNQTSFQDISDATGIPRGNFYYYFKTKDEILDAVVDTRVDDLAAMLKRFEADATDAREGLMMFSNILVDNCDNLIESGCPLGSLCSELAKDSPALHDKSKQAFEVLRSWVKRQFETLGVANADDLAMDLLAKLQGVSVMSSAFKDSEFVMRSHKDIKCWIDEKIIN